MATEDIPMLGTSPPPRKETHPPPGPTGRQGLLIGQHVGRPYLAKFGSSAPRVKICGVFQAWEMRVIARGVRLWEMRVIAHWVEANLI